MTVDKLSKVSDKFNHCSHISQISNYISNFTIRFRKMAVIYFNVYYHICEFRGDSELFSHICSFYVPFQMLPSHFEFCGHFSNLAVTFQILQ